MKIDAERAASVAPKGGGNDATGGTIPPHAVAKSSESDGEGESINRVAGLAVLILEELSRRSRDRERRQTALLQSCMDDMQGRMEEGVESLVAAEAALLREIGQIRGDIARLGALLTPFSKRFENLEYNTEQLRLQAECASREMERLSEDYMERHAVDPVLKEFAQIHARLITLEDLSDDAVRAEIPFLADEVAAVVDRLGASFVRPNPGDAFDPRIHQPIEKRLTSEPGLHGRIAAVHIPGLARPHRLVQAARVAVYELEDQDDSMTTKSNGKEQQ